MAEEEKTEEKVEEIELNIKRTEIPVFVEPDVTRIQYAITFWGPGVPPTTIFMWKDEWSKEKEAELIAEKLKEIMGETTEKVKVKIVRR